ncbi:hypothetical protein PFUGPA_04690 [Plasmodium falciparum Palo Alto/Uganda]|uniref:Ankyrin-repeat protein n=1 Tax=Plasmodium falciparum (isolate Palo Alto / Uganda) TaxID=57270 RepID=W4ITF6_PLAFP|nr:hypothetical protein PFUGPA_04690 [Plasmodium falciparum Palo Alto/Uganda]
MKVIEQGNNTCNNTSQNRDVTEDGVNKYILNKLILIFNNNIKCIPPNEETYDIEVDNISREKKCKENEELIISTNEISVNVEKKNCVVENNGLKKSTACSTEMSNINNDNINKENIIDDNINKENIIDDNNNKDNINKENINDDNINNNNINNNNISSENNNCMNTPNNNNSNNNNSINIFEKDDINEMDQKESNFIAQLKRENGLDILNKEGLLERTHSISINDLFKLNSDICFNIDSTLKKNNLGELLANENIPRKNERWKRYIKNIEPFLDVHTIINLSQTCKFFYKRKFKVAYNRLIFKSYLGYNPKILYEYVFPVIYRHLHRSVRRRLCLDFTLCTLIKDITVANILNEIYNFETLNTKHLFIYNLQEIYFDYCHHLTDKTLEVLAQTRLPSLKTLSIKCVRNKYLTCAPLTVMLRKSNWPVFTNFICSFSNAWLEPIFIISNFIINRANNQNHIIYHKLKNLKKTLENMKNFDNTSICTSYDETNKKIINDNNRFYFMSLQSCTANNISRSSFDEEHIAHYNDHHINNNNINTNASHLDTHNDNNNNNHHHLNNNNNNNRKKLKSILNSETECSISQSETNNNFNLFNNFFFNTFKHFGYSTKIQNNVSVKEANLKIANKKEQEADQLHASNVDADNDKIFERSTDNDDLLKKKNVHDSIEKFVELSNVQNKWGYLNNKIKNDPNMNGYNDDNINNINNVSLHDKKDILDHFLSSEYYAPSINNNNNNKRKDTMINNQELKKINSKSNTHNDEEKNNSHLMEHSNLLDVPNCYDSEKGSASQENKYKIKMNNNSHGDDSITYDSDIYKDVYEYIQEDDNKCAREENGKVDEDKNQRRDKNRYINDNNNNINVDQNNAKMKKNIHMNDENSLMDNDGERNNSNNNIGSNYKKKKLEKKSFEDNKKKTRICHKKTKLLTAENIFCMNILHNNVNTFDEEEEDDDDDEEEDDEEKNLNKCRCNGKSCIYTTEEINFKCDCDDCPFSNGYKNLITVDDPYIQSHFVQPNLDILGSWGSKCFLESIGLDIYVKGYSVALKNENIKICIKLSKKIQEELYELSKSEKYKNNNLVYLVRDKGSELLSNTPLTIETDDNAGIDMWTLPISLAISKKNRYLFYLVLKGGAKIDIWDYLGKSPLYIACEHECKEFVEVFGNNSGNNNSNNNMPPGYNNDKPEDLKKSFSSEKYSSSKEALEEECTYDSSNNNTCNKNNNDEDVESNNADALKKVDNSNTICISPYGNTCDSYYVTYPFDIENGYIPINIAVKKKNFSIVNSLVKNGENLNIICPFVRDYKSPLYLACENNISEIIQLLLENKANPNWCYHNKFTPILLAYNLNKAWVNHFIDAGAGEKPCDRHILTEVLSCAIFKNDLSTVQLLLKKYPQLIQKGHNLWSLPFIQAAKLERLNILKYLYSVKKEIINQLDAENVLSPIHVAAEEGHVEVLKFLLENEVNINLTNKYHQNALHIACLENQEKIVHYLLSHNIDINCKDNINGECPLMICIRTRNENLALLILNEGKNINYNLTNIHGETSLIYSIFYGLYDVADILMKRGADVSVRDINGDKSYNVACERVLSHKTCKKVLKKFLKLYRSQNKNFLPKNSKINKKNKFYQSYQTLNQSFLSIFRIKKEKKNKIMSYSIENDSIH